MPLCFECAVVEIVEVEVAQSCLTLCDPMDCTILLWVTLVAQMVKNLPARWETWVRSLDWKDPLEKGMAARSSILA